MPGGDGFVIRVAVLGAAGRMGQAVCAAVSAADDMQVSGRADPTLDTTVAAAIAGADVAVDFTRPDQVISNAETCLAAGIHMVIGTSSFPMGELESLATTHRGANVFVGANFAIGAVLMMRFAAEASRHMDAAEIVEYHHPAKLDSPSGTAKRTVEMMREASGREVAIHSLRLPGVVADQDVIFGAEAQTLTIRHATTNRTSFMPGVLLAVRGVAGLPQSPTVGLEHLLWPPTP